MFLGEEKSASELSFAEHLGTVRGVRVFDNARRGRFCGARRALGAIAAVSVAIPPRAGPLGHPSERKIPKRTALFTGRIWKATRFLARPLRIWRTGPDVLRAITPSGAESNLAENTGAENGLFFLALYVPGRRKTPKSRPPKTPVQKTNSYCC